MDNLEPLCYHCKQVFENEWGPIKTGHYSTDVVCAITEAKYLCIFEDRELEPVIEYVCGLKGRLDFVKYLHCHDLIFIASRFEFMTMKKCNLEHEVYHETDLYIISLEWNPSETGFVVCTKENEIIYFAFNKTSISLQFKCALDSAVPTPIMLGWGSGDAQFQGAGTARHRSVGVNTRPPIEESGEPVIFNDPPNISWRGNGDHLVVNYAKNNRRYVKVFNILLEPLYESEAYPNLGPSVSFMGFGQSIACFAIDRGANKIVIFEKNCRVKEDFYVPQTKGLIKKVRFHNQIHTIAIFSEDSENKEQYITLYYKKNNRWYLKQELYYPTGINIHDFFLVETEDIVCNLIKLVVITDQYIEWHTFRYIIYKSPQDATILVVDGRFLEFSKFDYCITPRLVITPRWSIQDL
ncbi:unnamed protein product [Callosobruchus maculatus]|uniref:ELP1 first N-terminal beta-propeller domain-containing protein n=1 Tax=Callosobruchus maculatus TaxID=64391 RepID=A0A653BG70_CALMS|nr:unnamed protein product [Callosobruchus maculatus]